MKTYWRRLQSNIFLSPRGLANTSWRRLENIIARRLTNTPWRCLEDILEDVLNTFWKRLQNVLTKRLEDILKTSWRHFRKTYCKHVLKKSWRHLQEVLEDEKCYAEDVLENKKCLLGSQWGWCISFGRGIWFSQKACFANHELISFLEIDVILCSSFIAWPPVPRWSG